MTVLKNNPLLAAEMERIEKHEPFPPLDTTRYQLPTPISATPTEEEWKRAGRNAKAQLEHFKIRYEIKI